MRIALAVAGLLVLALPVGAGARSAPPPSSYPSCGFYWNRNTPPTAAQHRANACLLRARRSGTKARLIAVRSTIEGDPIVMYLFVNGRSPVLAVVDSTRDAFGERTWARMRCSRMAQENGFLSFDGCRTVGRGKPSWLTPVKLPRRT